MKLETPIYTLAAALWLSIPALSVAEDKPDLNAMYDIMPKLEALADASEGCKLDVQIWGRTGLSRENCEFMINKVGVLSEASTIMVSFHKDGEKTTIGDVVDEYPEAIPFFRHQDRAMEAMDYVSSRFGY